MQANRVRNAVGAASIALLVGSASGQSFNIDIDSTVAGVWDGAPANTFGAGAAQPGTWNNWEILTTQTGFPLVDLTGAATLATISASTTAAGNPSFAFDNTGTSGDAQLLMDDGYDLSGADLRSVTIAGLAAGTYEVYSYGWAPDVPGADLTDVTINAVLLTAGSSAASPPPFANPGHFVLHTVTVTAGGSIVLNANGNGASFGTLNGIQVKLQGGGGCPEDVTGDTLVDVNDLIAVILDWGCIGAKCAADINGDLVVDVDDLIAVILAWGPC